MSDIKQGVTLEVMGEGSSMGPLNDRMKHELVEHQGDIKYDVAWTTLGEYLNYLVRRGVSTNVASFIGSATPRVHELGYEDRPPSAAELDRMRRLVADAMQEGAVGISSALIYPPASFSETIPPPASTLAFRIGRTRADRRRWKRGSRIRPHEHASKKSLRCSRHRRTSS